MKKMTITTEKSAPALHYGIIVLALIVLAVFSALGLARFGYTSILPAMQEGLHLTNTQTGELQTMNLIGYLLTVVFAGMLAARVFAGRHPNEGEERCYQKSQWCIIFDEWSWGTRTFNLSFILILS